MQIACNSVPIRDLLPPTVATSEARTRIRQRIRRLLEDRGKTNRALAQWLGHGDQWVSNLLAGRFSLSLDELDRVAKFFNVPPGEIVRTSDEPWELSPTEMRVVRALRMLPPPVRDHYATLLDYTIGTTPDEIGLLTRIRELSEENLAVVERWIDLKRFEQAHAQTTPDRDTPPETNHPPVVKARRAPAVRGR